MDSTSCLGVHGRRPLGTLRAVILLWMCVSATLCPTALAAQERMHQRTVRAGSYMGYAAGTGHAAGSDAGYAAGSGRGHAADSDMGYAASSGTAQPSDGPASVAFASLVQCLTANASSERSATFAGEMTLVPGATRMAMRIELLEHAPGESGFRPVLAPGVGMWRTADPGVKTYKHIEQVTNLSAPASYRALITFRWESHGRVIRREERRSPRCVQSAPAANETNAAPAGSNTPLE